MRKKFSETNSEQSNQQKGSEGMMNQLQCESTRPEGIGNTPVLERLKRRRKEYQEIIDNLDNAIQKLEANPEVYDVLESLNKIGHY